MQNRITMLQDAIDYLKCVVANKVTLAGYSVFGSSLALSPSIWDPPTNTVNVFSVLGLGTLGFYLLISTGLGIETYFSYTRTKEHIEKFGIINNTFRVKQSKEYCNRAGLNLAAREAGLEDKL